MILLLSAAAVSEPGMAAWWWLRGGRFRSGALAAEVDFKVFCLFWLVLLRRDPADVGFAEAKCEVEEGGWWSRSRCGCLKYAAVERVEVPPSESPGSVVVLLIVAAVVVVVVVV